MEEDVCCVYVTINNSVDGHFDMRMMIVLRWCLLKKLILHCTTDYIVYIYTIMNHLTLESSSCLSRIKAEIFFRFSLI